MKVVGRFKKKDGTYTPPMTAEEIADGKNNEYGVSDEEIRQIFLRLYKDLLEAKFPGVKFSFEES